MKPTDLNQKEEIRKIVLELRDYISMIHDGRSDYKDEIYASGLATTLEEEYGITIDSSSVAKVYVNLSQSCPDVDCDNCPSFVCEDSVNYDDAFPDEEKELGTPENPDWAEGYRILNDYGWDHIPEEERQEVHRLLQKVGL